jgi:hypothetical protein
MSLVVTSFLSEKSHALDRDQACPIATHNVVLSLRNYAETDSTKRELRQQVLITLNYRIYAG